MKRTRILIADDHSIVIDGLRHILESKFEIVGTVGDGRALLRATADLKPDVVIVDISMPLLNGIEATRQLKKAESSVKVIFLTMHADATYATKALEAGASGYVLKHSAAAELLSALNSVLEGGVYLSPMIAGEVIDSYSRNSRNLPRNKEVAELTSRQREVLQLIAEGHSINEMADILHISPRTVEFHKYRLREILGLRSTAELTRYAFEHGLASS